MTEQQENRAIGTSPERIDGYAKVTGTATYAFEQLVADPLYIHPVQSTIARGRIRSIEADAAANVEGVAAILTHENAPLLATSDDPEMWVLQSEQILFRGQLVAAVLAETPETARYAADLMRIDYEQEQHDVQLRSDHPNRYTPEVVNPSFEADTHEGEVETAEPDLVIDETYTTPMEHNNPMEPHATVAFWRDGLLTLYDSTQGVHAMRSRIAPVLGLDEQQIRVISPYVGGGFGSKGTAHAHNVLVALAAWASGERAVKLAMTRQQMFDLVGHRTPTIQRVRLGCDRSGRLSVVAHDVVEHTSHVQEFAEQTAVSTRTMYSAPNRRTTHRLVPLDVPVPFWMRAPGEAPGMFATEVAMDELAVACGLDPIELRARNEPNEDPESGLPYSARNLLRCLREGAHRFGWAERDPAPRSRRDGDWWVGTGVASSTYPALSFPGSVAKIRTSQRSLRSPDRSSRYRHRHLDRADADRRRRAELLRRDRAAGDR